MKKHKGPSFRIAQNVEISNPPTEIGFPICQADWDILRQKISGLAMPTKLFNMLGSALLGVFASAFVAYLLLPSTTEKGLAVIALATSAVALISGVLCLYFDSRTSNDFSGVHKKNILEEMDRIEKKYIQQ